LEHRDSDFYDQLGGVNPEEVERQRKALQAAGDQIDYLIHRTFKQSEDGQKLLELWTEGLIMSPTANPGDDILSVGINEGQKRFIRGILLTIKKVEGSK